MLWMANHEELGGVGGAEVLEEDDPGQHHHDEDQSGGEIPGRPPGPAMSTLYKGPTASCDVTSPDSIMRRFQQ